MEPLNSETLDLNSDFPDQTLNLTLDLSGSLELILPNHDKVTASRVELTLQSEPEISTLELKLEFPPESLVKLKAFFDLDPEAPVQRFRMLSSPLEELLPEIKTQNPDAETILRAQSGAILRLENYSLVGSSAWLDDAVELF